MTASGERIERLCREPVDERRLRIALVEELRRTVGFEWYAWLVTDPETEVGSSPLAAAPSLDDVPRLIRAKYLTTLNRWTTLDADAPAVSLRKTSEGMLERSVLWRDALSNYGVIDVASLVFRDAHGCWGWLDLWRSGADAPFDDRELAFLSEAAGPITEGLRRAHARTFDDVTRLSPRAGPVVMLLSPTIEIQAQTPDTEEYLRALMPPDRDQPPVPAGAYHVAAQLLAVEAGIDDHAPSARVHLHGGVWLTLRAARVGAEGAASEQNIAVSIEQSSPEERRDLFARCSGLTPRETELLGHLAQGGDTRTIAHALYVSEHTVQDHLKSIFAKTGARNRRTLHARLSGR